MTARFYSYCIFIISALISLNTAAYETNHDYSIKQISIKDGLSFNEVTSIIEDDEGFMWFGTRGGLNRWDGYEFKIFKGQPGDPHSLSPSIESLYQDNKNRIWIGTKTRGAFYFDPETESIHQIPFSDTNDSLSVSDKQIISFAEDKSGNIWMGGFSHGLNKLDPDGKINYYINNQYTGAILQLEDGSILVAAAQGLMKVSPEGKTTNFFRARSGYNGFTDMEKEADKPILWITGWNVGLIKLNYLTGEWTEFKIPGSPNAYTLALDKKHTIWVGAWGNGLWHFDQTTDTFSRIQDEYQNINTDVILSLYCDHYGDIWAGTSDGVLKISQRLPFFNQKIEEFSSDYITSFYINDAQRTFLGTSKKGLYVSENGGDYSLFSKSAQTWCFSQKSFGGKTVCADNEGIAFIDGNEYSIPTVYSRTKEGRFNSFIFTKVRALLVDGDNLWAGSQQRGLCCFEWDNHYGLVESLNTTHKQFNSRLNTGRISSIIKDAHQRLWVGTYEGLFYKEHGDSTFNSVLKLTDGQEISNNIILCLKEDGAGNVWVGTPLGLTKLAPKRNGNYDVSYFTKEDGLSDDYVQAIEFDQRNTVWISHNKGISSINIIDEAIFNYDQSNGIISNYFQENTSFKKDGLLYFAGDQGIAYFDPMNIWINERIPPLAFTNLYVQNKEVKPGDKINGKVILSKSINHTDEIELNYGKNFFSIGFSALNYDASEKNQYQYKLEGRDERWISNGVRNTVALNNLKPGNYTLHIKGSNNNNIWNQDGKSLKIRILPPFWVSWIAFVFYLTLIMLILFFIRSNMLRRSRLKDKLKLIRIEKEQEHALNEMKLRFYTNISHEFKTPLTLILGPVNQLLRTSGKSSDKEGNTKRKLIGIKRNAQDLLHLVNQLLDFRKAETDHYMLKVQATEVQPFFETIFTKYKELASLQNVDFSYHFSITNPKAWIDRDKLVKITNNLLSNAFKYLKDKDRKIAIKLSNSATHLILWVKDNGVGIPQDQIEKIFKRFYQLEESPSLNSTGIGLSLVNHFAQMHHGKISVNSVVNDYTIFTLEIPLSRDAYRDDEIAHEAATEQTFTLDRETVLIPGEGEEKSVTVKEGQKLLIVEDNKEVRDYIAGLFKTDFELLRAENGMVGLDIANKSMPDIIISDVMMPEMDGFEMCRKLRENPKTETVPIILLTAKDSNESRLFGTIEGADAYIPKPFDPDFLRVKVASILESREKLKSEFSKKVVLGPSDIEVSSYEGELIEKAIRVIEENLSKTEFDMDEFANAMHMSKTTLYRRMKSLTGKSPSEFVRSIRVKRAEKLLHDRGKTISEVAWETGFSEPKVFRSAFEKEFGMKPMKYRQQMDKNKQSE